MERDGQTYVLARSIQRRLKEKAIRKCQLLGLHGDLRQLAHALWLPRKPQSASIRSRF